MSHRLAQTTVTHTTLALGLAVALAACQSQPPAETRIEAPPAGSIATQPADNVPTYPAPTSPGGADTGRGRADARVAAAARQADATLSKIEVTGNRVVDAAKAQGPGAPPPVAAAPMPAMEAYAAPQSLKRFAPSPGYPTAPSPQANTENYAARTDNVVQLAREQPLSTFSIDVDSGSYSNVRRMLVAGERPPADAVRAEELINYFDYGHAAPASRATPFQVTTELADAPWNPSHQLLMIGLKGYDVPKATVPPSNLVFLIDTSGSMDSPDKLPLLKQAFALLVKQLRPQDRVSIVVYAGSAGLVLAPTAGDRHDEILGALERLQAGGSTNGGDGIELAYAQARAAYIKGGVNRVILATDGDFNVGTVARGSLETLVGDQRKSGIALSTLGFGTGNYNDAMAERLADVGNGNHAYIDTLDEARKVLVTEMQSTLLTIASDVKIQVEFDPSVVAEYRLVGYENRLLAREDFANDRVDAGEIGAGHEVTALYEITRVGSPGTQIPNLKYATAPASIGGVRGQELATVSLRYKAPGRDTSQLVTHPVRGGDATTSPSEALRFASAVAAYADLLRGGQHIGQWGWRNVASQARGAIGRDPFGMRRQFVGLVERAEVVTGGAGGTTPDGTDGLAGVR